MPVCAMPSRKLALVVVGFLPGVLAAQQFGQWSWQATLRASGRQYENTSARQVLSEYQERGVGLNLGLNGFLIHPAIAKFNLNLDLTLSRYPKGSSLDNDRLGFGARFSLFPEGAFPIELFASRSRYEYRDLALDLPYLYTAIPDQITSWGGRLRLRQGVLAGSLLGFESNRLQFRGKAKPQNQGRAFFDWSGSGARVTHHLRLDHESRAYGFLGWAYRDTTGSWNAHGNLSPQTRWDSSVTALRRSFGKLGGAYSQAAVRQSVIHDRSKNTTLSLGYSGGFAQSEGGTSSTTHDATFRWQRTNLRGLVVSLDMGAGWQEAGHRTLQAPRLGVTASYTWQGRLADAGVTVASSRGQLVVRDEGQSRSASFSALAAGLSLGLGNAQTLRGELELSWAKNQLRQAGEELGPRPAPEALLALGTEDTTRARMALRRAFDGVQLAASSDWWRRQATETFALPRFESTNLTHTFQANLRSATLALNLGSSEYLGTVRQEIVYRAGSLSFRPFRFLSVSASQRADRRRLPGEPWLDVRRRELTLTSWLGAYQINVQAYWVEDRFNHGRPREDQGVTWSISRSLGGFLPIVTAPERRGVIK